MHVLYVTSPSRTGAWLAEAFANDSASEVRLEEAQGAAAGLERLRERTFDAVLVSHEPPQLDGLALVDGLRSGGAEEPLVILGQPSEQELAAQCFEIGADAYICAHSATTRSVLWIVARATERHHLLRENRRLRQAQQHRLQQEHREAQQLLDGQRGVAGDAPGSDPACASDALAAACAAASGWSRDGAEPCASDALRSHYREILRAHVMMGSGNLSPELAKLAEMLAGDEVAAPRTVRLHVEVLEELVAGLGNRSSRHVMTRADLLLVEVLVQLAECYRRRTASSPVAIGQGAAGETPRGMPRHGASRP
jgi:DNA-binding NarL/FixJ family response regulator